MNFKRQAIFVLILLGVSTVVLAGTATTNMAVSANVPQSCIITTTAMNFGIYDPISANSTTPLDQTATLTVTCPYQSAATITLGEGVNKDSASTAAAPMRRMICGGNDDWMNYNLYTTSARSTVWGNTTGTGVAYTGTGASTSVTVYGRVAPGQNTLPVELYTDTVVVSITF
jgi:spore coat protein U-like protein